MVVIETATHKTRRNVVSHHNSRDSPDLLASHQFTAIISRAEIRGQDHKSNSNIHVGETQLYCSKNEKKTHSQTGGSLKVTASIRTRGSIKSVKKNISGDNLQHG